MEFLTFFISILTLNGFHSGCLSFNPLLVSDESVILLISPRSLMFENSKVSVLPFLNLFLFVFRF